MECKQAGSDPVVWLPLPAVQKQTERSKTMRNEVIFDKWGNPDIMVAFTPDELGLPAELKGKKVSEYLIAKYQATIINGVPYSLPYQKPAVDVNLDQAIELCETKGPGWHLITNDEWAALARQSLKLGTMPTGNTNSGKSDSHPEQTGTTYDGGYGKTLTGSGPVEWNHDGTAEGVADMCGNVWERVGGIRFLNGQVQVIPDNGAAAGADQSRNSKEWTALYTADGDPVYYNVKDGEIVLQPTAPKEKDYDGVFFCCLHERKDMEVPDKLIELGLYPPTGYEGSEYFWLDTNDGRCVFRGGDWGSGAGAGVFSLGGDYSRAYSSAGIGFRSAYVRYSGDSDTLDNLDDEATDLSGAPEDVKEQIKANDEKLKARAAFLLPETLPEIVRYALARQLAKIYAAAGGKDVDAFTRKAYEATDEELRQSAALSGSLVQVNIATDTMIRAMEQVLAATSALTKGKEATDHE